MTLEEARKLRPGDIVQRKATKIFRPLRSVVVKSEISQNPPVRVRIIYQRKDGLAGFPDNPGTRTYGGYFSGAISKGELKMYDAILVPSAKKRLQNIKRVTPK